MTTAADSAPSSRTPRLTDERRRRWRLDHLGRGVPGPSFLIANGNWLILGLVDVVSVAALVGWSLWVSARLERGSAPPTPVVVKTPRALAPVPPLAAGAFVVDAELAEEVTR